MYAGRTRDFRERTFRGKTGAGPAILSFRNAQSGSHADVMMLGKVALDLSMAVVVLSLISIALFFVFGAGVSFLTVAGARRRARRRFCQLDQLSHGCPVDELAEIDEALDRVLAEERGVLPGSRGG
ncbi:MAG TPA: hypothetical protein VMV92_23740 [Streptosporangiaceae bacterium]|nr:hypothetical protein [Streptosporangiaceae bacterium]